MSKSHVSIGYQLCPICGVRHGEVVLLDTHLKESLERETYLGLQLCPEHAAMSDEYVALVEVAEKPSDKSVELTGATAQVCWSAAANIFNVELSRKQPFVFVERGVIAKLQEMSGVK